MIPGKDKLNKALEAVAPFTHNTPVLTSGLLNELTNSHLYFKCENFQKMGAFKMRGAINAIHNLTEAQKVKGVVTHSSGNFGQAIALAGSLLKVKTYIVMPNNAPTVKQNAVAAYGGLITLCESTLEAREATAEEIVEKTGATFLHPSNNLDVIIGNATAGIEFVKQKPNLQYMLAPVGGGGLLAGTALAANYFLPECTVLGCEPKEADDAFRSLQTGLIQTNKTAQTVADGLRTNLGDLNFPIIKELVPQIIRVEESEIINAMKLIWERLKIVVEPSSAVPLAAILNERSRFRNKHTGIIISGGNVDLSNLPFIN